MTTGGSGIPFGAQPSHHVRDHTIEQPFYFRTPGASTYLFETWGVRRSPRTLAKQRCVGGNGPPFRKVGRDVVYERGALDGWAAIQISETSFRNTAEAKAATTSHNHQNPADETAATNGGRVAA